MREYGVLTLCGTPIGNLEDMTYRAVRALKEADLIAAEDTRHTRKLLTHFEIRTPLVSYHEHNKAQRGPELIEKLKEGNHITLVTDAGTPGISDPGEDIVKLAYEEGIQVTAVPGPVAGIVALIISGQNTRRFTFEGFLPTDRKERKQRLEELRIDTNTIILYEAPHRLKRVIGYLYETLGNRNITICRELTKRYEEVKKMALDEAIEYFKHNEPRGEYVLVIEGANKEQLEKEAIKNWDNVSIEEHVDIYTKKGLSEKDAMKAVAKDRGVSKREIYQVIKT